MPCSDPRLDIRLRDGRRELRSDERYDLVTLEPPPPSAAGVVNLYSRDFYQLAANRLQPRPGGAVAAVADPERRRHPRAGAQLHRRVPHASLWTTEFHEMLLIGSLQPLHLDVPRIQRFSEPSVASALAEVGVDSPQALLATWITDRAGLARYAGNAAAVTDDQPRIEYAPWVRPREITGAAGCWRCARHRRCRCAAPGFAGAVNDQWLTLQRFYSLSLHAYNGNCQAWAREAGRWCAGWCQPLFSLVPRQPSP
jgi:hypothetical protein